MFFDTDCFDICADSGASSCATPYEIYLIPGIYKHLTDMTINGIAEGLKVSGCGSVSWNFQDDNKENIELVIEQVLHIIGLPIRLISPQQVARQTVKIGHGLHEEKDEASLIIGGLKFNKKCSANSGLPIYNSVNGISKFKS